MGNKHHHNQDSVGQVPKHLQHPDQHLQRLRYPPPQRLNEKTNRIATTKSLQQDQPTEVDLQSNETLLTENQHNTYLAGQVLKHLQHPGQHPLRLEIHHHVNITNK